MAPGEIKFVANAYLFIDEDNFGTVTDVYTNVLYEDAIDDFSGHVIKSFATKAEISIGTLGGTITCTNAFFVKDPKNPGTSKVIIKPEDITDIMIDLDAPAGLKEKYGSLSLLTGVPFSTKLHTPGKSFYEYPSYDKIDADCEIDEPFYSSVEQEKLQSLVPGLADVTRCPVKGCSSETSLWYIIQHLNDAHKWTRERIADWLETLDSDITFQIGEENGNED